MIIYRRVYKDHKEDHDGTCELCQQVWPCDIIVAYNEGIREIPDLLTVMDVTQLLGISSTRTFRLLDKPNFPKPAFIYSRGRLYRKEEIVDFKENKWNRNPGRPKSERSYKDRWFEDDDEL